MQPLGHKFTYMSKPEKLSVTEEILGNGMRNRIRQAQLMKKQRTWIKIKATVIDSTATQQKIRIRLDKRGYVIEFPFDPLLDIWIPNDSIEKSGYLYSVDKDVFTKCYQKPLEDMRETLIIKHGMRPSLVNNDVKIAYPEL